MIVRAELRLDEFVVMPNHIHGIVFMNGQKGDPNVPKGDRRVALFDLLTSTARRVTGFSLENQAYTIVSCNGESLDSVQGVNYGVFEVSEMRPTASS